MFFTYWVLKMDGLLYSKFYQGNNRDFYFDMKVSSEGRKYIRITERKGNRSGRIFVFPEDIEEVTHSLVHMLNMINVIPVPAQSPAESMGDILSDIENNSEVIYPV
jgi:hypothetical protein